MLTAGYTEAAVAAAAASERQQRTDHDRGAGGEGAGQGGDQPAAGEGPTPSPRYAFLLGGEGGLYYAWRLHKIRSALAAVGVGGGNSGGQAHGAQVQIQNQQQQGQVQKGPLSIEDRMALLGEAPLPSTSDAQHALAAAQGLAGGPGLAPGHVPVVSHVAEGDKQRLREALQGSFVKGAVQDMQSADERQV